MNLIPLQSNPQSEFLTAIEVTIPQLNNWRHSIPLHVSSSFSNGVAEDVRSNSHYKVEVITKRKLSSLKGKVSKMSADEIDKQLKSLRDEWQRDT